MVCDSIVWVRDLNNSVCTYYLYPTLGGGGLLHALLFSMVSTVDVGLIHDLGITRLCSTKIEKNLLNRLCRKYSLLDATKKKLNTVHSRLFVL